MARIRVEDLAAQEGEQGQIQADAIVGAGPCIYPSPYGSYGTVTVYGAMPYYINTAGPVLYGYSPVATYSAPILTFPHYYTPAYGPAAGLSIVPTFGRR